MQYVVMPNKRFDGVILFYISQQRRKSQRWTRVLFAGPTHFLNHYDPTTPEQAEQVYSATSHTHTHLTAFFPGLLPSVL